MSIELAEAIVGCAISVAAQVYPTELKSFFNARGRSFWDARKVDENLLRLRSVHKGEDHRIPNPMFREMARAGIILSGCLGFFYLYERWIDKQDLVVFVLYWSVWVGAVFTLLRMYVVMALFVWFRAKILWDSLDTKTPDRNVTV